MVVRSLFSASLRFFVKHPWQLWLTLLSISLGSAVMIAVDLANQSAVKSFARSVDAVAGISTHSIVGGLDGIEESFYTDLRIKHKIRRSAPVVEGGFSHAGEQYLLLGTDFLSAPLFKNSTTDIDTAMLQELLIKPGSVLITPGTAKRLGVTSIGPIAVRILGREQTLFVTGFLPAAEESMLANVLLTDISSAQDLLARPGVIDRIDLQISTQDVPKVERILPSGLRLQGSRARSNALDQMTNAFRTNLQAMSLLAIFVSAFLVYNTMTFSVLQRRQEFAVQRMLGVTAGQLALHVVLEAAALAIVGSVLGAIMGVLLGQGLLILVSRTISDLYANIDFAVLLLDPILLLKGFGLTLFFVLLATVAPAVEAFRVPPVLVSRRSVAEIRQTSLTRQLFFAGLTLLGLAFLLTLWMERSLILGFTALFVMIAAYSLLIPGLISLCLKCLTALTPKQGVIWIMALRGVKVARSRTNLAIIALTISVSATVGVGIMIGSFRTTVASWLSLTLQSDLYITSVGDRDLPDGVALDDFWEESLKQLPGVRSISHGKEVTVTAMNVPVRLLILKPGLHSKAGFRYLDGYSDKIWQTFLNQPSVLISEPFAYHHQLSGGDTVELERDGRQPVSFKVAGVFQDYSATQGMLVISHAHYLQHWTDSGVSSFGLSLADDADKDALRDQLSELSAKSSHSMVIRSNADIRARSLAIFDRTFAITNVLRVLVIVVAFVGVFSALMALFLEKHWEFSVLRATGMTKTQLNRMILLQVGVTGLIAGLLSLPLGWAMSEQLISVINQRSFGWTMDRHLPLTVFIQAIILSLFAAVLAGLYPIKRLSRGPISRGLREL